VLIKMIPHPKLGTLCFGRRRPLSRSPQLKMKTFLDRTLPAPPPELDFSEKAAAALAEVYGNDVEGDCTSAGPGHIIGVLTGNATGTSVIFTLDEVNAFYSACEGAPGFPAIDNGADEPTVLNIWRDKGYALNGSHKIAGSLSVDPANPEEQRLAVQYFGNLMYGLELPDAWVNPGPADSGFVWDVAGDPDPNNGHCFVACGYKPGMTRISTWGMTGWITDAAVAKYCAEPVGGELYTVLDYEWINKAKQKSPTGIRWAAMYAAFESLAA
jgi:hypothetical protein